MRKILILTALALCLPTALPSFAQIKPGGKWVMHDVKIINKSDNPDFTYTPTSVTYKNSKSYSYYSREGGGLKEQTISDVLTVNMSWGAPPPVIKSSEEGKLEVSYSIEATPDRYQDQYFRRLRQTPGFDLEMRVILTRVDGRTGFSNPEWRYRPTVPKWGSASSGPAMPLRMSGEDFSFFGIDVTDGKWQIVLRIIADFSGFDLEKYDEEKEWHSCYVIEHYYRYETDKASFKRVSAGGLSFDLDSDFTIAERSPLNPGETLVIVPEGKRSTNDQMFLILNTDVLSGIDVNEVPAEKMSDLMKTAAKKLADTAASSFEFSKKPDITYYMDGRCPTAYAELKGKDAKGNPVTCRVESKLVNGSVVSACSVASDKDMLSAMRGIYGKVVSAAADR
ncbi:MAG: hypothetical protein IJV37_02440 [Bacteroidales bacterium]|nr:hypothetical protein [Bacteroidales bacterium]